MKRSKYFRQLADLYARLDGELPTFEGNACGDCYVCCTSDGLNQHKVTALELDYLEKHQGSEKIDEFRLFLKRDGEIPLCPYYRDGCTVYEHRPYSCRVFGHYRRNDTKLPEVCVFRGQEHIFGVGEYRDTVPEGEELIELSHYYWAHRVQRTMVEDTAYQAAGLEDPLGKALECLLGGDVASALEEMEHEEAADPFTLYSKSLILEEAGRPDLACSVLEQALEQAPESPDLWHRLGCSLFALGDREASERAFRRVVEYHPSHGQAWGLLGMHRLLKADFEKATDCLERAVELLPDNPVFSTRLQQAKAAWAQQEGH